MADRYIWPVILTQMYKQVSIKVSDMKGDDISYITDHDIIYNRNYEYLAAIPDDAKAQKLASITKHLTNIVRAYLAGKADWQEVEEALRRI